MSHDPGCYLARWGAYERGAMPPCEGRLIHAHVLPRQLLTREGHAALISHPASWVWACGGPMGNAGHHGMFDAARTLRLPRLAVPLRTELLAHRLGLTWWLEREYGKTL